MIYIGTTQDNGSAIYFDIHTAERQGRGMHFCGTLGDGSYEGEVLVEIGGDDCVTFADAWIGGSGFSDFVDRCGAEFLERALLDSVREMSVFQSRPSQPHSHSLPCRAKGVAESLPLWNSCSG
jgi:hypothetical protein